MRRRELEIKDKERIVQILDSVDTIRLGIVADGMPYIIPMVFGFEWIDEYPVFYMHSGMSGRKNQGLYEGARVCFELDCAGSLMTSRTNYANNFSKAFACIMGEGVVSYAMDAEEKKAFFAHIMKKMTGRTDYEYQSGWLSMTNVFCLRADKLSAAEKGMDNLPKEDTAENFSWSRESKTAENAIFWD